MRDLCGAVAESTGVAPNLMVIGPENPVAVEFERALRAGGVVVGGRLLSPREQRGEAFWRGMSQ